MDRSIRAHTALSATVLLALAACSTGGGSGEESEQEPATGDGAATSEPAGGTAEAGGEVVLVTHDSFTLPDELIEGFSQQTGYELTVQTVGDAGALVNQLVLTQDSPIGDVAFGVDNTFASRAANEGVFAPYSPELPEGAEQHALAGEGAEVLTPVDFGDVCVNIDDTWFAEEGIDPPATLQDLTDPTYDGLFVTPGASTSSPGLAFLLATIGEFGEDGWQDYWRELMANGTKVTSGWTDAYTVDFTAGGGDGDRPIVLSYASSPPFTIPEDGGEPTTSALLETCFRQVEYAGVLEGAANPEGGQALVDYLLTDEVQAAIPNAMYVFPVAEDVELPEVWSRWAKVAEDPITVDPDEVEANREEWVREWADIATG
ncbi:thiamine ABC transporter substrate-binding protein [Ornithinicoccus halotolerans]|uniref:thiamine ABC transporter substrate-binding protein n=1 Tax=Ornithinicoccus halotolerans TaxID=1748220 RepID=UPI0012970701|nr:thiamine ABC transporter substrate-binding protein [Ornithinicoccus halotolerans]